jgi:hypothetical protein
VRRVHYEALLDGFLEEAFSDSEECRSGIHDAIPYEACIDICQFVFDREPHPKVVIFDQWIPVAIIADLENGLAPE